MRPQSQAHGGAPRRPSRRAKERTVRTRASAHIARKQQQQVASISTHRLCLGPSKQDARGSTPYHDQPSTKRSSMPSQPSKERPPEANPRPILRPRHAESAPVPLLFPSRHDPKHIPRRIRARHAPSARLQNARDQANALEPEVCMRSCSNSRAVGPEEKDQSL